jgi:hypothetical protein
MSSDSVNPYLPTLEKLRAAALFRIEHPASPHPRKASVWRCSSYKRHWCGVRVGRRKRRMRRDICNAANLRRPSMTSPVIMFGLTNALGEGRVWRAMDRPGFRKCRVCGGRGRILDDKMLCSCTAGWVTCPNCGGKQQIDHVRLRYYSDTPAFLNEAYMPTHIAQNPSLFRSRDGHGGGIEYAAHAARRASMS